jgi:hypothetical protein
MCADSHNAFYGHFFENRGVSDQAGFHQNVEEIPHFFFLFFVRLVCAKDRHEVVVLGVDEDAQMVKEVLLSLPRIKVKIPQHHQIKVPIKSPHPPRPILYQVDNIFHLRNNIIFHLNQIVSLKSQHHQSRISIVHEDVVLLEVLFEELVEQVFV